MRGAVSWAGFAEEIFKQFERPTVVRHISSEEYKQMYPESADRPHFSILDNAMLRTQGIEPMSDWKDAFSAWARKEKET